MKNCDWVLDLHRLLTQVLHICCYQQCYIILKMTSLCDDFGYFEWKYLFGLFGFKS